MTFRLRPYALGWLLAMGLSGAVSAATIVPISLPEVGRKAEFRIDQAPASTNPFDPDLIRIDATITPPSGPSFTVPAFWYQAYTRNLQGGTEVLTVAGSAQWRVRFTPGQTGSHTLAITILTNGVVASTASTQFNAASPSTSAATGAVRVASSRQYFELPNGDPLRLIGANVCWPGSRGTYDYDTWFPAMKGAGQNFARLWMCPWAFGLEAEPGTRNRYRLDRAWQLDRVFDLASANGIYLLLCLDYHGMFATEPDMWGGNNMWPSNPYNTAQGGPASSPNGFFTNANARSLYQKRLRYLVGRYGYSSQLLAWEFFNEIDNVYSNLSANDVAAWHGLMGRWFRTNDPFHHLVTTSLTGNSDRPELWTVPELDFAAYHSYGEPAPATRLATVTQSFLARYQKPVMIGEFGISAAGWNRASDPHLRGFRQALWGGALGGSVGTAMSWWWENIHSENAYPTFSALAAILNRTGWGRGPSIPVGFRTSGLPPPTVGDLLPGGAPFQAQLTLDGGWGSKPSGQLAVPSPEAAGFAARNLNAFVHGNTHAELRIPFRLSVWLTNNARLVLHLNSVSQGATLVVKADGSQLLRTNLPNPDGTYTVNNEFNIDLPVNLPAGRRLIEITNAGADWFYLDWVRIENALPARYANNWEASPDALGLTGERETLLYVIAPYAAFPSGATNATLPQRTNLLLTLTNWPPGSFIAEWYDPASGTPLGFSTATTAGGDLPIPLPPFREDLAGLIYPPPRLEQTSLTSGQFGFRLLSETGGRYDLQSTTDFHRWDPLATVTNVTGTNRLQLPTGPAPYQFFRASKP